MSQVGDKIIYKLDPSSNIYGDTEAAAWVVAVDRAEDESGVVHERLTLRVLGRNPADDRTVAGFELDPEPEPADGGSEDPERRPSPGTGL